MTKPAPHLPAALSRSLMLLTLIAVGSLSGAMGGCSSTPTPTGYERVYPEFPSRAQTLDIQVFRQTKHVKLTNTTATAFGPGTLWLNAWYSRPIDGFAVGETLRLPLTTFRDEHAYAFRGGGFFAVEAPERLALAELEIERDGESVYYRLVVVGGEDG